MNSSWPLSHLKLTLVTGLHEMKIKEATDPFITGGAIKEYISMIHVIAPRCNMRRWHGGLIINGAVNGPIIYREVLARFIPVAGRPIHIKLVI